MVAGNFTEVEVLVNNVASLTKMFQAIGGVILAYIIFNVINTIFNKKKRNELRRIRKMIENINRNVSKLVNKKN